MYLYRFERASIPNCRYCDVANYDAEHTIFQCDAWETKRSPRTIIHTNFEPSNMIQIMLDNEMNWNAVNDYINSVMENKKEDERMAHDKTNLSLVNRCRPKAKTWGLGVPRILSQNMYKI